MLGSYLQNYLNNTNVQVAPKATPDKKAYLTVTNTIDNSNKVTPDKGRGHLIDDTVKDKIKYFAFDRKYDAKALIDGYKGEAKDHQLGRLNDVGLLAGGAAIATYIATSKQTAKAKVMEFVGLASFLAAMKVWPKIAIEKPAKLIHGFNVNKQYIDDQGRKKSVFQDSQYIPWDLYTGEKPDENFSVIGDKMGIRKDIPNRDEVVKDQMRKVATQNNALWMLSSGIATPVLGALGACAAEKFVDDGIENVRNKKADAKINSLFETLSASKDSRQANPKTIDKVSEILGSKQGATVGEDFVETLTKAMSEEVTDKNLLEGIKADLSQMLTPENAVLNGEAKTNLLKNLSDNLEKLNLKDKAGNKVEIKSLLPKMEELEERLSEAFGTSIGETIAVNSENKAKQISDVVEVLMSDKLYEVLPEEELNKVAKATRKTTLGGLTAKTASLTAERSKTISEYLKEVLKFQKTHNSIDGCINVKVGNVEDSVLAKNWGKVEKALTKALGISDKELKAARLGRVSSEELFAKKLEELAASGNEESYKKALDKIAKEMNNLNIKLHGTEMGSSMMDKLFGVIDKNYEATQKGIQGVAERSNGALGKSKFLEALLEERFAGAGSHKNTVVSGLKGRINSVESSYMRIINAFDIFKRANSVDKNDKVAMDVAKKVKEIALNSHAKDFSEKFFTDNNLSFYKKIYNFMCNGETASETREVLDGVSPFMNGTLKGYKERLYNIVGNDGSKIKTRHTVTPNAESAYREGRTAFSRGEATAEKIFATIGKTPSELLKEASQKQFNSNKWLKTFGGIGAGVLALTVAAQFAFGGKDDAIKEVK